MLITTALLKAISLNWNKIRAAVLYNLMCTATAITIKRNSHSHECLHWHPLTEEWKASRGRPNNIIHGANKTMDTWKCFEAAFLGFRWRTDKLSLIPITRAQVHFKKQYSHYYRKIAVENNIHVHTTSDNTKHKTLLQCVPNKSHIRR